MNNYIHFTVYTSCAYSVILEDGFVFGSQKRRDVWTPPLPILVPLVCEKLLNKVEQILNCISYLTANPTTMALRRKVIQ